jgi:hypothetical protein
MRLQTDPNNLKSSLMHTSRWPGKSLARPQSDPPMRRIKESSSERFQRAPPLKCEQIQ